MRCSCFYLLSPWRTQTSIINWFHSTPINNCSVWLDIFWRYRCFWSCCLRCRVGGSVHPTCLNISTSYGGWVGGFYWSGAWDGKPAGASAAVAAFTPGTAAASQSVVWSVGLQSSSSAITPIQASLTLSVSTSVHVSRNYLFLIWLSCADRCDISLISFWWLVMYSSSHFYDHYLSYSR